MINEVTKIVPIYFTVNLTEREKVPFNEDFDFSRLKYQEVITALIKYSFNP